MQPTSPVARANTQMLHRFLGIGITSLAVIFLMLSTVGTVPLLRGDGDDGASAILVYVLLGVATVMVLVALLFLRPRVPQRQPAQSVEAYWAIVQNASAAFLVWFTLEGAAILAGVAFLLTGHPAAALAMGIAIVTFWLTGPNQFARH